MSRNRARLTPGNSQWGKTRSMPLNFSVRPMRAATFDRVCERPV
jgi:hypothetical protein